jgi:hypothetical protein
MSGELKDFVKQFEDNLKESEELISKLDLLRTSKKEMEEEIALISKKLEEMKEKLGKAIKEEESRLSGIRDNHIRAMSLESERITRINKESDEKKDLADKLLIEARQRTNVLDDSVSKFSKDYSKFQKELAEFNILKHDFEEAQVLAKLSKDKTEQDIKQLKLDLDNLVTEKADITKAYKVSQEQAQKNIVISNELAQKSLDIETKIAENKKLLEELDIKNSEFKAKDEEHKTKQAYLNRLSDNLKAKELNLNKLQEESAFNIAKAQKREQEAEEKTQELAFELAKLKKKEK